MEEEFLEYTDEGELNRYLYYQDFNEINIFVEDKDKEYEYETIFERLLNGKYKIVSLIAAGGKHGVENAFYEFGETNRDNGNIKNIYIVDGDFDRYIHQEKMIENEHFIYLRYYNIENYIIDKNAIIKFSKGKLKLGNKNVETKVGFETWQERFVNEASELFILYCTVQKYYPYIQNVARNEYKFIDINTGFALAGAYDEYYQIVAKDDNNLDEHINEVKLRYISISGENYFGLICGKLLFLSLYVYLCKKLSKGFSKDELRWNLINNFNINKLSYLAERIDKICA